MVRTSNFYIIVLMLAAVLSASAQGVTYNHDESVMNQVKTTEIAYSGPDLYHKLFHRSYRRWATDHIYSKQTNRAWVMGAVREQKHMAEEIDSAYTKRFEAELANMLDRQVDIEWETTNVAGFTFGGMGEKIRKQQQRFKQYIQRISFWGGSAEDSEYWTGIYNCINEGIDAMRDAYQPNSSRKAQYIAIYDELSERIKQLLAIKEVWVARRDLHNGQSSASLSRVDAKQCAMDARGRWKLAWLGRSSHGSGGGSVGGGISVDARSVSFSDDDTTSGGVRRAPSSASSISSCVAAGHQRFQEYKNFKLSIQ